MEVTLEILSTNSVGANDNIVVVSETGVFGVLGDYFHVETGAVLDRESLVVEFTQQIDIFVINLANSDRQYAFLRVLNRLCHFRYLPLIN